MGAVDTDKGEEADNSGAINCLASRVRGTMHYKKRENDWTTERVENNKLIEACQKNLGEAKYN